MLYLEPFTFNPFQENTYVIYNDEKQCWIVDPGMYSQTEVSLLFNYIESNSLKPESIINTHTHIDHILGINAIVAQYDIPFHFHEMDLPVLNNAPGSAALFGFEFKDIPNYNDFLKEQKGYKLGDDTIEIKFTPGHSPGSVVFYNAEGNWVIGGDVLFAGSIGRTDLPGGNHEELLTSIRNELFSLPDNTVVYPGHGPSTTIGHEKQTNPFFI